MFDGADFVTPIVQCLVVLLVLLGLLFLGGLVPTLLVARRNAGMPEGRRLMLSVLAMSEGALGIVLLCSVMGQTAVMRALENSNPSGQYTCMETPISSQYKIQVTRLGNGQEWASALGPDRMAHISSMKSYAIAGDYLVGTVPFDEYFWLDLRTGAYRYLSSQDKYVKALEVIGITQPPDLSPATDLCKTGNCVPCAR